MEELRKGSTKSTMVKRRIITYLICNGKATITDLAKDMDLSVPTVTKFVDEMIEDGYVLDNGKLETSGGRYPNLYGLCADAAYFWGLKWPGISIVSVFPISREICCTRFCVSLSSVKIHWPV